MNVAQPTTDTAAEAAALHPELRALFHRLNNQLGIVLAQAELLESRAVDDAQRARATQLVTSTLAAMGTVREIRQKTEPASV